MKTICYSLEEVKKSGKSVRELRYNGIRVDVRRNTCHDEYVEAIKKLEIKPIPKVERTRKEKKPKAAKSEKKAEVKPESKKDSKGKVSKLADLEGISDKDIAKLKDLGIETPAKLAKEDLKELSKLSKITQKQLKTWIDQIK